MRERPTIEPRFFETYHYADVITAAVEERFEHLLIWDEFFCDGAVAGLVVPYQPRSAFHTFVGFVIDRLLVDYTHAVDLEREKALAVVFSGHCSLSDSRNFKLPVERALKARRFDFESFVEWLQDHGKSFATAEPDDVESFFEELRLCGPYEELVEQSTRETFFTLFGNRTLLRDFNVIVAQRVAALSPDDVQESLVENLVHFERPGVLRRAHMPEWVRRAVFFRDRGCCVRCHVDLTGVVSVWSEENYDHVVPLASGGLNDVTNIQLLCAPCNQRKADGEAFTSGAYEDWYPIAKRFLPGMSRRGEGG